MGVGVGVGVGGWVCVCVCVCVCCVFVCHKQKKNCQEKEIAKRKKLPREKNMLNSIEKAMLNRRKKKKKK